MLHKKRQDKHFEASSGIIKWLNKIIRFILFPLIHPLWFVFLLFLGVGILFAWPLYNGVQPKDISSWYLKQLSDGYRQLENTNQNISQNLKSVTEQIKRLPPVRPNAADLPDNNQIIDYETPQMLNRRIFEAAQTIPIDVKATLEAVAPKPEKSDSKPQKTIDYFKFRRNSKLPLKYLDEPIVLSGVAKVINSNELFVEDKSLFLYGIYANPASEKGEKALDYLIKNVQGKIIMCKIVAYTNNLIPTAVCALEGYSLNQKLVDLKYSQDVSLN